MQLYASPLACSLASHIALLESGQSFDLHWVDAAAQRTADGRDFRSINPKGMVPTLIAGEGHTLTESIAVLSAIADRAPQSGLLPPAGTPERERVIELLSFLATELHARTLGSWLTAGKSGLPLAEYTAYLARLLQRRLDYLESQLSEAGHLAGEHFSVADAYLVAMLNWTRHLKVKLDAQPKLGALFARLLQRPSVQQAMQIELKAYRPG